MQATDCRIDQGKLDRQLLQSLKLRIVDVGTLTLHGPGDCRRVDQGFRE